MAQPQFEALEVFSCIEMEKGTTFILVEGNEVDIYENVLRGKLGVKGHENLGWTVASGSDKETILEFRRATDAKNFHAVLDGDFDGEIEKIDRVTYLDRYSIENYLFDEMVIRQTTARLYRKSPANVDLGTDALIEYYQENLSELFSYLRTYQLSSQQKVVVWSESKLLGKACWQIDTHAVDKLINEICADFPEIKVDDPGKCDNLLRRFPGKLVMRGIYYYIKKHICPPKFTAVFNNETVFQHALFWNVDHSINFVRCLDEVADFIRARQIPAPNPDLGA